MAADTLVTGSKLTAIANAIRTKGGTSSPLTLDQMPQAVADLPSGGGGFDWTKVKQLKFTLDNWQSSFSCDGMEEAPLTGCYEMFANVNIPEIDIAALDLTRATTLGAMFSGCSQITSMTIEQQCPATNIANMFYRCQNIEAIDLSGLTGTLKSIASLCNGCYALKSIYMPNIKTAASVQISNAFYACEALDAVIWATNSNSVQALGSEPNASFAPSNVIFYVPDALVADYKAATNWATIADRIKGISELPATYKTLYSIE